MVLAMKLRHEAMPGRAGYYNQNSANRKENPVGSYACGNIPLTPLRIKFQDSAHERRRITPTEISGRVPKVIGNGLAHVLPIRAPGFKPNLYLKRSAPALRVTAPGISLRSRLKRKNAKENQLSVIHHPSTAEASRMRPYGILLQ
jgi:hypothetical protein